MLNPCFIVNPSSNKGKTKKRWMEFYKRIKKEFKDSRYFFTGAVGHGIELAESLANSGHDWIVAVGGDGTINEIVNGIMRSNNPKAHFSFLCAGSGGDFRKTFGLPRYLEDYISLLKNPRKRVIDIAKVSYTHYGTTESRYFANICSAGISALVCNELPKRNRHLPGDARYLISTILAFGQYTPAEIEILIDNEQKFLGEIMVCAVANGMFFGGGMKIAPDAKCDDKLLDVVIQKPQAFVTSLKDLPKLYSGDHVEEDFVEHFKGQKIDLKLRSDNPVYLEIDGESIGSLDASFEVIPNSLNILI